MTADLTEWAAKVKELSADELLTIQEIVTAELRRKIATNGNSKKADTPEEREAILSRYFMPQPTKEELEAYLKQMFPPEILALMGHTDFSKLPAGTKSLSEMIIEDREDRL